MADQNLRSRQRNSIIRTNTVRQYVPHAEHWGRSICSTAGQRTMSSRIFPPCREADGIYWSVGSGPWSRSTPRQGSACRTSGHKPGAGRTARQPIGGDQRAAGLTSGQLGPFAGSSGPIPALSPHCRSEPIGPARRRSAGISLSVRCARLGKAGAAWGALG